MNEQNHPLAVQPIGRLLARFAVPSIISMVVNALYNIVDQIFIGHGVGYQGNAATNIVFPLSVATLAVALLIGDGCAAYFSLKLGQGNRDEARRGVGNVLTTLGILGVVFLIGGQLLLDPVLRLMGASGQVLAYSQEYGRIIALGFPFVIIGTGLNASVRADGSPKYAMASMLLGALINTVLDPVFIFVFQWGMAGAAWATILGQIASAACMLCYLPRYKNFKLTRSDLRLRRKTILPLISLGVSSCITQLAGCVVITVSNRVLVEYGALSAYGADIPLAAFGIVMKVNQIVCSVIIGIGVGAQPIAGYNYGAGNYKRVLRAQLTALTVSTVVSTLGWLVFQLTPQTIVSLFGNESDLYDQFATHCFRTYLLMLPVCGIQITSGIFFQSIGKPAIAAALSLSRQVLFLAPLFAILPRFWGLEGVLLAGPIADGMAFAVAAAFLLRELLRLHRLSRTQGLPNG